MLGLFGVKKRRLRGTWLVYINIIWGRGSGGKKTEADYSQCCPDAGQRATGTGSNTGNYI